MKFEKGQLVEILTNKFKRDFNIEYGTPGRVITPGPNSSNIGITEGHIQQRSGINIPNIYLRRPRSTRGDEFLIKSKKTSAAFLMLRPNLNKREINKTLYPKLVGRKFKTGLAK